VLSADTSGVDAWSLRMTETPAIVVSSTIEGRPDWPTLTVVSVFGDGLQYRTHKASLRCRASTRRTTTEGEQ
jgi:hypothetical protein